MVLKRLVNQCEEPIVYSVPHIARLYSRICKYYKYEITPILSYGVAMGMSFEYMRGENYQLTPDFGIQGMYFGGCFSKDRRRIARNLRVWLDVYRSDSDAKAYSSYVAMLSQGIPLIVEVNLQSYYEYISTNYGHYLAEVERVNSIFQVPQDYYINAYSVILAGINEENRTMICLDANFTGCVEIPYDVFMKMHSEKEKNINAEYEWIDLLIPKHKQLNRLDYAIIESIKSDIKTLQSPCVFDSDYILGFDGMRQLYSDAQHDEGIFREDVMKKSFERVYFISEIICGSTGLGRKTFADFLKKASEFYPELFDVSIMYEQLGDLWSTFLNTIHNQETLYSEKDKYIALLARIISMEQTTCERLKDTLSNYILI